MSDFLKRFSLEGKVALVTGGGRGLGAEIAKVLAAAGARVMVGDAQEDLAQATADQIRLSGGDAQALRHDVTDEYQWQAAVAQTIAVFGSLDVLVNNAGIEKVALFTECRVEDFREMHEVNVTGVFLGIKHASMAMRPGGLAGRGGAIVNLSSVAGLVGMPGLGGYCSSKGAVRLMTKAAAVEFAALGYGIRVNSVHPAIVKTELGTNVVRGMVNIGLAPDNESADAYVQSLHPMGYGQPGDVASAVLFLASEASAWTNGAELALDGGATAR